MHCCLGTVKLWHKKKDMKYTIDKKAKALIKEELQLCANLLKEIKLRKSYPIELNVEYGFYVIHSKLNYDTLL
jgi:hypothetical protein